MSEQTDAFDASTFDLDAWIDEVQRPEVTVHLYPREAEFAARIAQIEAQIPDAEATGDGDRGMDDATPEQLLAQIAVLKVERQKTALPVRVRQLTKKETRAALVKARKAGAPEEVWGLWGLAEACVEPAFTPQQLVRLYERDASGEAMVDQLAAAVTALTQGLTPPFSPAPSGGSPA